ncbi:MAG: 30S ribosome-binding factor RbfA [candidate division WOR-3 bacterium]|nr:MAG: 30S ribosome-binding factor RbfA [candidate division WOR-3 bacterium]
MREKRIASVLEREVSTIITQDMRDPRLGFITVTRVEVSPDLKTAIVYFSSLEKKSESLEILNKARGFIRTTLARRVKLKFMPELQFKIDDSYEYGKKIDELFETINRDDTEE